MTTLPPVGVLGFGAFGRLLAAQLRPHAEAVLVHDPRADPADIEHRGLRPVRAAEAAAQQIVLLAVPVQALAETLDATARFVRAGAVVADVCSVKMRPLELMAERLPVSCEILGTHPLFGPQTVAERGGIAGLTVALCPHRAGEATLARAQHLMEETLGLRTLVVDADEHDRQMAFVQAVTHLVGHAAREAGLVDQPLATLAYTRLLQLKTNVERDSEALFETIQRWNPHAAAARAAFAAALAKVRSRAGD